MSAYLLYPYLTKKRTLRWNWWSRKRSCEYMVKSHSFLFTYSFIGASYNCLLFFISLIYMSNLCFVI
ncbi:hypothetical protein HanIR_Chr03g0118561 [Helianthus annuus]|nr:hypothetical protein HanIR_Chr03g0118561 [Helianthus annuus]